MLEIFIASRRRDLDNLSATLNVLSGPGLVKIQDTCVLKVGFFPLACAGVTGLSTIRKRGRGVGGPPGGREVGSHRGKPGVKVSKMG